MTPIAAPLSHVVSLHLAPGSRLPMKAVESVQIETGRGITGDRYAEARHRQVTIQSMTELAEAEAEHGAPIEPSTTRRNITISAGEIPRQPGHRWSIGTVHFEVVRTAAPCKLLEDLLGPGAKRALHGRAGVVCRVIEGGTITLGDPVTFTTTDQPAR